jgi:methyl-accepting chemotaxis protein
MVVTGSSWQKLTLGSLIPALDPDKEGSVASKVIKETERLSSQVKDSLGKVENLTRSVSSTLKTVGDLGKQIDQLQKEIENLIGNAVNTGVFMHVLGLNPIFSDTQPTDVTNELRSIFFVETDDPNRPVFKGDTASVGGILLIITAPNVNEMIDAVKRLAIIFPVFERALNTLSQQIVKTGDLIVSPFAKLKADIDKFQADFDKFDQFGISAKPFTDLFDRVKDPGALVTDPNNFDRWFALRVSDLIPALNPNIPGSPASIVVAAERDIVGGAASLLKQADGLASGVDQLSGAINTTNRQLQKLATNVTELVTSLGNTGIYIHTVGLDGSISNSQEFVSACGNALTDLSDKDRPRAAGQMTAFAGMVIVFGAANPLGLGTQFKSIGTVFGGLNANLKTVSQAARF